MMMLNEQAIHAFLEKYDFDVRKSQNGRWFDQKCTPDVISIVADCVFNYVMEKGKNIQFNSPEIWRHKYTEENVRDIFNKPSTGEAMAKNEYDKFFAQPLEMLAYSNVLTKIKRGNRNFYIVNNLAILEFIALRERNALLFIKIYIEKVLRASGIWPYFESFLYSQSKETYASLKDNYEFFIIQNTKINGKTEVRRIFTKVINPLAYYSRSLGSIKGRISKNTITYMDLMYNRENFRDLNADKPKGMTRKDWHEIHGLKINEKYYKYQSNKAKNFLKRFNDQYRNGLSEVDDELSAGYATQIHHIFPEHEFPEIAYYLENLIALTPSQHFIKAHPRNNTQRVCKIYQELLLKSKAGSIEENIYDNAVDTIYSFGQFMEVISTGFESDYEIEENDFATVMSVINEYYTNE